MENIISMTAEIYDIIYLENEQNVMEIESILW